MYIRRINKGGSLLVTPNAPKEFKGFLKGNFRWSGQIYHVPSLKYWIEQSGTDDQIEAVTTYLESLKVGDYIDWDVQTDEAVLYTQDRHGNDLPEPRKSTRLYADFDPERLDAAILGATAPKPATKGRKEKA